MLDKIKIIEEEEEKEAEALRVLEGLERMADKVLKGDYDKALFLLRFAAVMEAFGKALSDHIMEAQEYWLEHESS